MSSLIFRNTKTPSLFGSLFDNVGDAFFSTYLDGVLDNVPSSVHHARLASPAVNVSTTDEDYKISVACPGADKNDLSVKIRENILTVSYQQEKTTELSQFCTSFQRSWALPKDANCDTVTAEYEKGIFNVVVPRTPPVEPEVKEITIK